MTIDNRPVEDDIRTDDHEYNPAIEPKKAKAWLNLLEESEDAFEDWNNHCDNIDKQYASSRAPLQHGARQRVPDVLGQLRGDQAAIYAKPPLPVVTRNSRTGDRSTRRRANWWSAVRRSRSTSPASTT